MIESPAQFYRGVRCMTCTQPIPLPAILAHVDFDAEEKGMELLIHSRVFSVRCRSCEKEKLYHASQIEAFEGTPKPRVSRANRKMGAVNPSRLSRAAQA